MKGCSALTDVNHGFTAGVHPEFSYEREVLSLRTYIINV
jgi:hypothetical protein